MTSRDLWQSSKHMTPVTRMGTNTRQWSETSAQDTVMSFDLTLAKFLDKSKQVWVRVTAAKELTLMGDSAGYQFFVDTLQQRPFYHDEMVCWLRDAFPATRCDEADLAKFLNARRHSN